GPVPSRRPRRPCRLRRGAQSPRRVALREKVGERGEAEGEHEEDRDDAHHGRDHRDGRGLALAGSDFLLDAARVVVGTHDSRIPVPVAGITHSRLRASRAGTSLGGTAIRTGGNRMPQAHGTMDVWTFRERTYLGSNVTDTHADIGGFKVEALDGSIGKVDNATYEVGRSHIVVDTGPWIFGKKVMLPAGIVRSIDESEEQVFVNRT